MILDLSEDGKFVVISSFKTPQNTDPSVTLRELRAAVPRLEVQFFEGGRIAGTEHLKIAAINALHAFKTGINISRNVAMETLLYASAQRQIDEAIRMLGVTRDSRTVGLVAFSETRNDSEYLKGKVAEVAKANLDDSLLDAWSENEAGVIMTLYGITAAEIEAIRMRGQEVKQAITKAVIERVALLSTRT